MATFYGGEQLSQVVRVEGTQADVDAGERFLIYTVPTGYYGLLKFAFVGLDYQNYPSGTTLVSMFIYGKEVNPANPQEVSNRIKIAKGNQTSITGYVYLDHRAIYRPNGSVVSDIYGNYDFYLQSGDKFYIEIDIAANNQDVKYELELHLYKKP